MVAKPAKEGRVIPNLYDEKYRPQFHFSSPRNWLNDPNGLVWHNGLFHLFYQYNPTGNEWGNMHWGHAVSKDLMHWNIRPTALYADPWGLGFMYSGCVVSDPGNRSGLGDAGRTPLVALYTSSDIESVQSQSLAYSLDDGETWQQYEANPVIGNPGIRDFRDPKVFWHQGTQKWVMGLAADDHVEFFQSRNLIDWRFLFKFGKQYGSHAGVWECPDLFPLETRSGEEKWVLIVSVSTEHTQRDESIQYFVGDFDGNVFTPQHRRELWLDYGADNYGAVTWSGVPAEDGRRIIIGWMNSWRYANALPTYPWRGNFTLPRTLHLVEGEHGLELKVAPVAELRSLCEKSVSIDRLAIGSAALQDLFTSLPPELLDLELDFTWEAEEPKSFGLRLTSASGDEAVIAVDLESLQLVVDRSKVGQRIPNKKFAERFEAPIRRPRCKTALRIVKDRASVEVFGDKGRAVITANLFFDAAFTTITPFSDGDATLGGKASILRSVWRDTNVRHTT